MSEVAETVLTWVVGILLACAILALILYVVQH